MALKALESDKTKSKQKAWELQEVSRKKIADEDDSDKISTDLVGSNSFAQNNF